MGHGPRGLQRARHRMGLFHARSSAAVSCRTEMRYKQASKPHIHDVCSAKVTETGMKLRKRLSGFKDACDAWLRSRLNATRPKSDARASILSAPKLIVQPDDGEKPIIDFLHSAQKTVALKQFTFTHPLLLDAVLALHKKGVRVRVMLNAAKTTGERLNDPFFEKMKSSGIELQWSNPDFLVTHEKSIIVDGKSALLATFNFMARRIVLRPGSSFSIVGWGCRRRKSTLM